MLTVGKACWTSEFPNFQIFPTMDTFQLTRCLGQFINATEWQSRIQPVEITEPF